jgi:WXXGXW repeat (2 copies)
MKRKLWAASAVLFGTLLTSCGGYVVASYGPPPPRYGAIGYAPGPGYVWTEGYWNLAGGSWVWAPGRWLRPPRPHSVWVAPEWRREGRGYRFHRGRWR